MMDQDEFRKTVKSVHRILMTVFVFVGLLTVLFVLLMVDPTLSSFKTKDLSAYEVVEVAPEVDEDLVAGGIHVRTGLIAADGYMVVVNNCTNCHSAKLVTQNRMNAERWAATIDWMQATQNLGDLGRNEEIIINYLVQNYPPKNVGRRAVLTNIEWYELE